MTSLPECRRARMGIAFAILVALAMSLVSLREATALIRGGTGNEALRDPGWPAGAAPIFNHSTRVAWWEGPPFGGGQWHAECRGDAKALNEVLAEFAKVESKNKRIVVHDGIGRSFWLNPNREAEKKQAAQIDWVFMVWQPGNWDHLRKLPGDLKPADIRNADQGPPLQLEVYTGGSVTWADVKIPKGLEVEDQRLEAHGYSASDGVVVEGTVTSLESNAPLAGRVRLQRVETPKSGGYEYVDVLETMADEKGHWVLKKIPEGWFRIVADSEGFVARVIGYVQYDEQPHWQSYATQLSKPSPVAGRVRDDAGAPLADVRVRIGDVVIEGGERYESIAGYETNTDQEGRFRLDQIPVASASVWVYKSGYVRPGLGESIKSPKHDIELTMKRSARAKITVDFTGKDRPAGYVVQIEPEGGSKRGTWGGSGNIDANNQIAFDDVPPGRYVFKGRPNPGSDNDETAPITIELKGGETSDIKIVPK